MSFPCHLQQNEISLAFSSPFFAFIVTLQGKTINYYNMQQNFRALCEAVEQKCGKRMLTASDFEWLVEKIEAKVKECISASTLMRIWGYRQGVSTRQTSVDVLARFLGYADYVTFCQWAPENNDEPQSDEVMACHLRTADMTAGQQVELSWYPDRRCLVQLRKDGLYEVLEAENTKLSVGDTFRCDIFIESEPLYLSQLIHEGRPPMVYVAGKKDGIRFSLTSSPKSEGGVCGG